MSRKIASIITGALLVPILASAAAAQTAATAPACPPAADGSVDDTPVQDVVVTGEAYATQRAIDAKRERGIVSDGISASEIDAIPEFGLGEAPQRIPGVSFQVNNGRFDRINAVNDQWYRATNTIDAQVGVTLIRGLDLRFQGKNITDETNQKVVGPDQRLNCSLLDNGRAYYAGVAFAF